LYEKPVPASGVQLGSVEIDEREMVLVTSVDLGELEVEVDMAELGVAETQI